MKVQKFKSLKEERKFWDTHDSTAYHDAFKITKNVVFVRWSRAFRDLKPPGGFEYRAVSKSLFLRPSSG